MYSENAASIHDLQEACNSRRTLLAIRIYLVLKLKSNSVRTVRIYLRLIDEFYFV